MLDHANARGAQNRGDETGQVKQEMAAARCRGEELTIFCAFLDKDIGKLGAYLVCLRADAGPNGCKRSGRIGSQFRHG